MAFIFEACSCNSYTAEVAQQTRGGNQGLLRSNGAYFIYVRDVKTIFKEILRLFFTEHVYNTSHVGLIHV